MSLRVTILGCGSSGGVPRPGLGWGACDPANPKNRRRRCSLLVERLAGPDGPRTRVLVRTRATGPVVRRTTISSGNSTCGGGMVERPSNASSSMAAPTRPLSNNGWRTVVSPAK